MRIFRLFVFTERNLYERDQRIEERNYNSGFHDAVDSLCKAIDSKDKIVLGNGMSFVGAEFKDSPLTIVGNGQHLSNSVFFSGKKKTDMHPPMVRISKKLE